MDHNDHVNLLRPADLPPGGLWADLGAGSGAFTLALRELVGPGAEIHAVEKDWSRLGKLERAVSGNSILYSSSSLNPSGSGQLSPARTAR